MTKPMGYGLVAVLACAFLMGCGGSGGEPTVAQTVHDELQAELDAALAMLMVTEDERDTAQGEAAQLTSQLSRANTNVDSLTDDLAAANAEVARLEGLIGAASDAADPAGSLHAQLNAANGNVASLTDDLAAANASVASLTADLTATETNLAMARIDLDTSNNRVDRLEQQLATANGRADTLSQQLDTANGDVARLTGELATAEATVESLTDDLAASNANAASLTTQLASANNSAATLTASVNSLQAEITRLTGELATTNGEITRLTGDLATATARVTELETLIGDSITPAANSLRGMLQAEKDRADGLEVQLASALARVTALTGDLEDAEAEAEAERRRAEQAARDAQAEADRRLQEQAQNLTSNQRAQNLKAAFPDGTADTLTAIAAQVSPVTMTGLRGSLRLERLRYANASISGSGIRSATMSLQSGGDPGKTVVYTDRELTRQLLAHYGDDVEDNAAQFDLAAATVLAAGANVTSTAGVSVSHRLRSSLPANAYTAGGVIVDMSAAGATNTGRVLNITADFFTGSVHGVSGRFRCAAASGAGCQVTATGTYNDNDAVMQTPTENQLNIVTLAPSAGMLHFRPNSATATVSLCDDIVRCTAGSDDQYMVFGYWREDPVSAAGVYQFDVFAENVGTGTTGDFSAGTATYDGIATGAYVEQDPNDPVDTHRQGEFTADVFLTATAASVSGTIDDFVVTPTGGSARPRTSDRWVLTLINGGTVHLNLAGGGTVANTLTQGNWTNALVPHHANTPDAGTTAPPAVTGVFQARIIDFVHLVGAYGAQR